MTQLSQSLQVILWEFSFVTCIFTCIYICHMVYWVDMSDCIGAWHVERISTITTKQNTLPSLSLPGYFRNCKEKDKWLPRQWLEVVQLVRLSLDV